MSSSSTPRSEPTGRSSLVTLRLWTSVFRSRPASILPRRGSGEWTPFLVILALAAGLIVQFAAPGGTELPEASGLAVRRPKSPTAPVIPEYPAVLHAPIFAPDRAPGEASAGTAGAGGVNVQVLGLALDGRTGSAVVKGQDGATHVLSPGQEIQGWRLLAVTPTAAVFSGQGGRASVPVGGPPPTPSASGPPAGQTNAPEPHP